MLALTSIVLAVVLASPFGAAEASAVDDTDGLTVDIGVEVDGTWVVVLVRPFSSFEELPPTALVDRGDGVWGGQVRLPTAEDWSIVFDAIDAEGEAVRSDTTSLSELGVDPIVIDAAPDEPLPSDPIPATTWWLIGGIVLALAALAALGWWTFGVEDGANAGDGDSVAGDADGDAERGDEPPTDGP